MYLLNQGMIKEVTLAYGGSQTACHQSVNSDAFLTSTCIISSNKPCVNNQVLWLSRRASLCFKCTTFCANLESNAWDKALSGMSGTFSTSSPSNIHFVHGGINLYIFFTFCVDLHIRVKCKYTKFYLYVVYMCVFTEVWWAAGEHDV